MRRVVPLCVMLVVAVCLMSTLVVGCGGEGSAAQASPAGERKTITDLVGRTVEVPTPASAIVALGPGALRLVCYVDAASAVVGIENVEKQWGQIGRPYAVAHPELLDLAVIGQGGPDSTPDPEMLLQVAPDVIFVAYLADTAKADELQSKTGIPVVVLSYGELGTFDKALLRSLRLVGEITGNQGRAEEVVAFIENCERDLVSRTSDIPEADKPTVYVGGLGMKGTHGIESSSGDYPPLAALGAKNVVDETGSVGSVMIDKEQLIVWDPDIVFIDEGGLAMVREDYGKNPGFYESLSAFGDGNMYGFLPYNYYTTNVDTALADAYFMGTVVFPRAFADVDPEQKADEIYSFLLGAKLYDRMAQDYGGFLKIDLGSL